jgi:hypothetical protein
LHFHQRAIVTGRGRIVDAHRMVSARRWPWGREDF